MVLSDYTIWGLGNLSEYGNGRRMARMKTISARASGWVRECGLLFVVLGY